MLPQYIDLGLEPWLRQLRSAGRYEGMNGENLMTNAVPLDRFDQEAVVETLQYADQAKLGGAPFVSALPPQQGLSFGLNPYTDWTLKHLDRRPSHWYVFFGTDWYSVSSLGDGSDWFSYLENPFPDDEKQDRFWVRLWAWMLERYDPTGVKKKGWLTPVPATEAADFIKSDGGGFLFHNLIPYLRPAGEASSGSDWHAVEWGKDQVREDIIEDLRMLRGLLGERVKAFCTGSQTVNALMKADWDSDEVINFKAHPSQVFHPATTIAKGLSFQGRGYWR